MLGLKNIYFKDTVDSTNIIATQMADKGAEEKTVVVAESQTAGRGRMRRSWVSPPGKNLYFSIILRPNIPLSRSPQIALLTAVAVYTAINNIHPGLDIGIKWPNDILLNNKKLSGILCEMKAGEVLSIKYIIVGVGINVNISHKDFPDTIKEIATSMFDATGLIFDRSEILEKILNTFFLFYEKWLNTENLSSVIETLNSASLLQSKMIKITQADNVTIGKVEGIAETGELILHNSMGNIEKISSGEAHILSYK